jgi:hypothetical protein
MASISTPVCPVVAASARIRNRPAARSGVIETGVSSRAYKSGVYPRKDRFLFDFNERYRREMGRPTLG